MAERQPSMEPTPGDGTPPSPSASYSTLTELANFAFSLGERTVHKGLRVEIAEMLRRPTTEKFNTFAASFYTGGKLSEATMSTPMWGHRRNPQPVIAMAGLAMALARTVDDVKINTIGFNTRAGISNTLVARSSQRLAFDLAAHTHSRHEDMLRKAGQAITLGDQMLHSDNRKHSWMGPKVMDFGASLYGALNLQETLVQTETLADEEAEALRQDNNNLFASTQRLQRYGVKPCVADSLGTSTYVNQWQIERPSAIEEFGDEVAESLSERHGATRRSKGLAAFTSTNGTFATAITAPSTGQSDKIEHGALVVYKNFTLASGSIGTTFILGHDGHLVSTFGIRLNEWAADNNATSEYEMLRAEVLSIYFDLVTPNVVTDLVTMEVDDAEQADPSAPESDINTRSEARRPSDVERMRRLVLARQIVIRELGEQDIEQHLLREIAEDKDETRKRTIAGKDISVTWHIRRLPEGYKASAKQRELCFEKTGIILAESGETYVDDYDYATEDSDTDTEPHIAPTNRTTTHKGHRARFRTSSASRRRAQILERRRQNRKRLRGE